MPKIATMGWKNQPIRGIATNFYDLDMENNYAVVEDAPGVTVLTNINPQDNLSEKITLKYSEVDRVSTSVECVYDRTSKKGYQLVAKDETVVRTYDDATHTYNDDPMVVYIVARSTNGSGIVTGAQLYDVIQHLMSAMIDVIPSGNEAPGTVDTNQKTLDRLKRGATKPAALI